MNSNAKEKEKKTCDCCGIEIDDTPVQITIDRDTFDLIENVRDIFYDSESDSTMCIKDLIHFAVTGFENSMNASINRGEGAREFLRNITTPVKNLHLKERLN